MCHRFGEVDDFLIVSDFGSVGEPVFDVRLVHEAPFPPLRELCSIAQGDEHGLSLDVRLDAVIVMLRAVVYLHRVQVVAEVLIALSVVAASCLQVASLARPVTIEAELAVGECDVPMVSQREMLVVLRPLQIRTARIQACKSIKPIIELLQLHKLMREIYP